ncbi:MAG: EAL domain-containing protein [Clostridiales bacterium]|nr:EAL domain-containing protein [Clostridiales bacterium]
MVNGKKIIAICISRPTDERNQIMVEQLNNMSKEKGYGIIVYNLISDIYDQYELNNQVIQMIDTINYDYVDAVVVIKDHLITDEMVDRIIENAAAENKPRILVRGTHDNAFSIRYQGDRCFEAIMRHVIECHQCKNVYFMAGIEGADYTEKWIEIYRKVLEENGLAFDERKIGYGGYWSGPTVETIEKWREKWIDKGLTPDAIVCANDLMALAVCDKLEKMGYLVPENIIVTGFEGFLQAKYHHPRITTGEIEYDTTCDIVMEVLDSSFSTGEFYKMNVSQQYILEVYQSCGCKMASTDNLKMMNRLYDSLASTIENQSYIFKLAGRTTEADNIEDVSKILSEYVSPYAYIALREGLFENDKSYERVDFDDTLDVITNSIPLRSGQKKMFPYGVFLPNYEMIDQCDKLLSVYPVTYDEKLYGYFIVTDGMDAKTVNVVNTIVNLTNVSMNMVKRNYQFRLANENLSESYIRDSLTGLYNMKGFSKLVEERYFSVDDGSNLILFSYDINRLRSINEGFGHEEGDSILINFAEIIRANTSSEDIVARYGVDEFLIAVITKEDVDYTVYKLINGIETNLHNYNMTNDKIYSLSVCNAHIVGNPKTTEELELLIKEVLKIKRINKKTNSDSNNIKVSANEKEDYEILDTVLRENKLRYMFQPLVDAGTGEIFAYEALMRTADGYHMSPVRMIELAMKYNRLSDIEHLTMYNVFDYVSSHKELFKGKKVFVNSIVTNSLNKEETDLLFEKYRDILDKMVVEITEHTDVSEEKYQGINNYLGKFNVQVAIDDYGTGYSNTARILRHQPDYVKIDRLLINGIQSDYKKQHFVENIIEYAHGNGFLAIAEGVETSVELKTLICMGVDIVQGYYTGRPSFEVVDKINDNVKKEIIRYVENSTTGTVRLSFIGGDIREIDLEDFTVSRFNEICITAENVKIKGIADNFREVNVKFEKNKDYEVTLENVALNPTHVDNVIAIGENSHVHLIIKGDVKLSDGGILVPETSSLTISGDGHLSVNGVVENGFCIGGDYKHSYGNITIDLPNGINLHVEGENGIAIGGGFNDNNASIEINNTKLAIDAADVKAVGIGTAFADAFVRITRSAMDMDIRGRFCCAIGSIDGNAEVTLHDTELNIVSSGDAITGLGSISASNGCLNVFNSKVGIELTGKEGCCIGAFSGETIVSIVDSDYKFRCEGASMLCLGTRKKTGSIAVINSREDIYYSSADYTAYGALEDKINIQLLRS